MFSFSCYGNQLKSERVAFWCPAAANKRVAFIVEFIVEQQPLVLCIDSRRPMVHIDRMELK